MDHQPTPNEQKARCGERLPIQSSLVIANGAQVGEGRVIDLSMRGCFVEASVCVKAGDRLQLRLCLPDSHPSICVSVGHHPVGSRPSVRRRVYEGGRPELRSSESLYHLVGETLRVVQQVALDQIGREVAQMIAPHPIAKQAQLF